MVSIQAKEKATKLLQSFFGVTFFNDTRMSYIFNAVKHLDDSQFLRLIDEALTKEIKPGVDWFAARSKSFETYSRNPNAGRDEILRPDNCKLCHDAGVVFVKTERADIKSLAMRCTCDCDQSKLNFWELPIYSADHCMIDCPYTHSKLIGKIGFEKASGYFVQHMRKSKKIWDGEI